MSTAKQTQQYDRGYEGAIEGHKPRGSSPYYRKGYAAGLNYLLYRCESGEEVAALCQREAEFLAMTTERR